MKAKLFSSFLIATLLLVSFAAAVVDFSISPSTISLTKAVPNATFQVMNTGTETVDFTGVVIDGSSSLNGKTINFVLTPISVNNIQANQPGQFRVTVTGDVKTFSLSEIAKSINVTAKSDTGNTTHSEIATVNFNSGFCENGPAGRNISISDIDVNNAGEGEDDEWNLLDKVSIDVDVENNGDDDLDDVIVEMALYDSSGINRVDDLDFSNTDENEYELNTIRDGDEKTATFEFTVPADMDDGSYKLAFKAYSDDSGEDVDCADEHSGDTFQQISIDRETDEEKSIVVSDVELPQQATCRDTISGTFTVFNIGDEDQDQVLIEMKNSALNVNQEFVIREDLDEGDDQSQEFSFDIPANIKDGTYSLDFKTFSDFDDGVYETESEDTFSFPLRIVGCSPSTGNGGSSDSSISVSASLASDAEAGKPLIVTARIRNTGSSDATIVVDASEYESWATLDDISERIVSLDAGESATVTFTFDVNDNAKGSQSFTIETSANGETTTQEVGVNIAGSSGLSFDFGGNSLIWIIGGINVILLILVIVVAVRFSRK